MNLSRKVNFEFDTKPSLHHQFVYQQSIKFIRNKKVLDIGCWSGQFIQLAVKKTKKIYGIDPDEAAVKYGKKITSKAIFSTGSALKIPFKSNFFDVVVFSDVIEHIPNNSETKALKEINRVLKSQGILIITTPSNHLLSIALDPAYFLINHRHYSKETLVSLLTKERYKIKKIFLYRGLVNLLVSNLETLYKYVLNKKPTFPHFIKKIISKEFEKGFASIFIIAQKN